MARKSATRAGKVVAEQSMAAVQVADAAEDSGGAADAASGPEMKRQELIEAVMRRADLRKQAAKPVVEAVLEVLAEALAAGRALNLPPLGRVKLTKVKEAGGARILVARIRQAAAGAEKMEKSAKVAVAPEPE